MAEWAGRRVPVTGARFISARPRRAPATEPDDGLPRPGERFRARAAREGA